MNGDLALGFTRADPHVEQRALSLFETIITPRDEELVAYLPVGSLPRCSRCERPADDLLDRAHGERVCGKCRELERERFESETGECWRGCGYDLRWHRQPRSTEDECPTEDEARRWSGAQ